MASDDEREHTANAPPMRKEADPRRRGWGDAAHVPEGQFWAVPVRRRREYPRMETPLRVAHACLRARGRARPGRRRPTRARGEPRALTAQQYARLLRMTSNPTRPSTCTRPVTGWTASRCRVEPGRGFRAA